MIHLPHLIIDLGFILVTAALVTLLFRKLRQPVVLGYLLAGFFVSPHFPWLPNIQDGDSIQIWAEIGVIFLLFGLGLEFSFKKLLKVGAAAGFTAVVEVVFMIGIGYVVGRALGWNTQDSLFLGGILSISSTTIIVRAFQELNMKTQKFVDMVFGILVVEDIVAVMLLVLLPSLASSDSSSSQDLVLPVLRMVFFVLLWFIMGIFLLPAFLRRIRPLLEEESTLVISIGLCLMMVFIASAVGLSPALGAFVMGSLLAETPEGHQIEKLLNPVKNLFAAVFFVSVGMLINPEVLKNNVGLVLLLTVVTILGKMFSTYGGLLLAGQPRKTSLQSGLSLAQIGEFSFIIASLGMSIKATSDFLYPLAVAVSAVTTFTTPYLIKLSPNLSEKIESILPEALKRKLDHYERHFQKKDEPGLCGRLLQAYGIKLLFNFILVLAITFLFRQIAESWEEGALACFIGCLLFSVPFFWGLTLSPASHGLLSLEKKPWIYWAVGLFRFILAGLLMIMIVSQFSSLAIADGILAIVVFASILVIFFFGKRPYRRLENEFLKNLDEKERLEKAPH